MHQNAALLEKLFTCLNEKDHEGMAACYDPEAKFEDIAFNLDGRKQIHAMWHMISETDLCACFKVLRADSFDGEVALTDVYTFSETKRPVHNRIRCEFQFRDGLIVNHRDSCNALWWGIQALGPLLGLLSWIVPKKRKEKARKKLEAFIEDHPEYDEPS